MRNVLLILFSVLLLGVVSLLTFHLYNEGTREVISQFHGLQLSYAKRLSTQIQFYFEARARGLKALSSLVTLAEGAPERRESEIEAYGRQIDKVYVIAISLYNDRGGVVHTTGRESIAEISMDEHLLRWAQGKENRGSVLLRPAGGSPQPLLFTLATPLYGRPGRRGESPRFAGVLTFTLDIREFLTAQLRADEREVDLDQVWIVDKDGTILFQPDHPEMVMRNIYRKGTNCTSCHASFGYVEKMLTTKEGVAEYETKGHPGKVAAFAPMGFEGLSWVVVVNAPHDRVTGFVTTSLRGHAALLMIMLLAVISGAAVIVRKERMKIKAEEEVVRWQEKMAERRKAEEALNLEKNKLKAILDSMTDGVYIVASDFRMVYANPVIERDYGQIDGRRCYEYLHGRTEVCESCRNEEVFRGKTMRWEWYSPKAGKTFDVFDTPYAGEDGVACKLSILRDISDRTVAEKALRESEERYRTLVQTMNDGLAVQDEQGVWTYVNDRFCEMLGYGRDELVGRGLTEFLAPTDIGVYEEQMAARVRGEKGFYELSWLRKDRQVVITLVSSRPIFDDQGQFRGSFAVLTAITERKRAEEALRESERQLRHLSSQLLTAQETERKRISREIHDELGQALTVMKLHMSFLGRNLSGEQVGLRSECDKGIEYIDQVIENVRRLSRDLSPIILEDFGLSAAVRWLINNFAKRYNIKVSLDLADIDSSIRRDDQTSVYRILQEALTNIGRHSRAQNVRVAIAPRGPVVVFCIEDDGKGFDVREMEARGLEEKGLGLATMHGRARMLGGALEIHAEEGKGTCISMEIPVKDRGN